jgi:hypothetical protein
LARRRRIVVRPITRDRASRLAQCVTEHELNLSIQAAQIVIGPPLQGVEDRAIDPEQKGLAIRHAILGR